MFLVNSEIKAPSTCGPSAF